MNKKTCKIGLIQLTSGDDVEANIKSAGGYISELAEQGAEIVFLPENAFFMRREAHHKADVEYTGNKNPRCNTAEHPGVVAAQGWAKQHGLWIVIGSIAPREAADQERPFNRSVVINPDGNIAGHYDKIHLFDVEFPCGTAYMESTRMAAGEQAKTIETPWGGVGLTICYDLRFPNLYRSLAQAGASMLSIPAAFTTQTGEAHWHVLLRARAIETGAFVIASAQTGEHPGGRQSYGHALVINPWGEVLLDLGKEPGVGLVEINLDEVTKARATIPAWNYEREYHISTSQSS